MMVNAACGVFLLQSCVLYVGTVEPWLCCSLTIVQLGFSSQSKHCKCTTLLWVKACANYVTLYLYPSGLRVPTPRGREQTTLLLSLEQTCRPTTKRTTTTGTRWVSMLVTLGFFARSLATAVCATNRMACHIGIAGYKRKGEKNFNHFPDF